MAYIDGFVIPVPKKKVGVYRRMATTASKVWKEHGALQYVESVADDVKRGKLTSFPRAVKLKPGETVVFAFVVHRSRKDRDRTNEKAMNDPRLAAYMDPKKLPFDGKRMFFGGFEAIVEA